MRNLSRWRPYLITAALTAAVLAVYAGTTLRRNPALWAGAPTQARRMLVLPLQHGSSATELLAGTLADSLAATITRTTPLQARVGRASERDVDYVLEGDITEEDDRIAIALRIRPAGQRAPTWTGTFWRNNLADPALPTDLSLAIAHALHITPSTSRQPSGGTP